MEYEILIGLVVVLVVIIIYLVYRQNQPSTSNMVPWSKIVESQNSQRNFYTPEVRELAKEGRTYDGKKYTGSSSKYFPEANTHPTLNTAQIEDKSLDDVEQFADEGDSGYDYDRYMDDAQIDEKTRKDHKEWTQEQRFFNGVARSADDEFETANYLQWTGLRMPQPIKPHGMMPFITEVQNEELGNHKKFNFQG